jgi:hypothetical protein
VERNEGIAAAVDDDNNSNMKEGTVVDASPQNDNGNKANRSSTTVAKREKYRVEALTKRRR